MARKLTEGQVVALVRDEGRSLQQAAVAGGTNRTQVKRWCDKAGVVSAHASGLGPRVVGPLPVITPPGAPRPVPAPVEPYADADIPTLPEGTDDLGVMIGMRESLLATHRDAMRTGNHQVAMRAMSEAVKLAPAIKAAKALQDDGRTAYSREEIDQAMASALAKIVMLTDRPLTCAQCGVELAIEWSGARDKVDASRNGNGT